MCDVLIVPFSLDSAGLAQQLKIRGSMLDEFNGLVQQAAAVAQPRLLLRDAFVEAHGVNSVTIEGVCFESAVLRHNLEGIGRVFPYIATCGHEVDVLLKDSSDFVLQSWLHYLKLDLLNQCFPVLYQTVQARFGVAHCASMNPGSGDASVWPIEQQAGLFSLFGDVEALAGVRLTESYLMDPDVSSSGILFPSTQEYKNCQLCRRVNCPNRAAPFNAELWAAIHD